MVKKRRKTKSKTEMIFSFKHTCTSLLDEESVTNKEPFDQFAIADPTLILYKMKHQDGLVSTG